MKKSIKIIGVIVLILLAVLLLKRKLYDPKHRIERVKTDIEVLAKEKTLKDGDIIFQTSQSAQSKAIQDATHSKYSHCGIIYQEKSKYYVFEAVQPVKITPLEHWIARGENGHFVIKRLKNAEQILTAKMLQKMKHEGEKFKGKKYDIKFEWDDNKIYCSELIWKVYQRSTGIELCKLGKLKDFDFSKPTVKQILKNRFDNKINLEEPVISPVAIFNSELLITVKEN